MIVPLLTRLYQHSLEDETVFSEWKLALVIPIHKGDDETDAANYRPISLLSIPSKILESVVNDALVTHVFALTISPLTDSGHLENASLLNYF